MRQCQGGGGNGSNVKLNWIRKKCWLQRLENQLYSC